MLWKSGAAIAAPIGGKLRMRQDSLKLLVVAGRMPCPKRCSSLAHLVGGGGRFPARGEAYRCSSMKAVNCDLDKAPTRCPATSPFLNRIRVGIPRMPYFGGVFGFSSTFSFATFRRSLYNSASSSMIGATIRQGPHHSAQKSTSTGSSPERTSLPKFSSPTAVILALKKTP